MRPFPSRDYERIERAIAWLHEHWQEQPELSRIAAHAGLSAAHFDRLFTRWAGVSPMRFARFLTKEAAIGRLAAGASVLETALEVGMSGPGRLHDTFVTCEAVTPGEAKTGGLGVEIRHGAADTPFGRCWLAATSRGICRLEFLDGVEHESSAVARLRSEWPNASLVFSPDSSRQAVAAMFSNSGSRLPLHLRGTNFQIQVWQALLRVPDGALATYQQIARAIGSPAACRAVGSAVGANPISYLIPCHRVIRKSGLFGNYRWGPARKLALCGREAAKAQGGRHRQGG